ncbi:MAG TPA: FAD-binding oxidoreductase [Candidatus Methylomirabilis sp.]|nr:FAD-binding oxidoreductase [Candidatus Methylomirabilis sp.]
MNEQRIVTTGGLLRALDGAVVEQLARSLRGPLLRRGDDGYDAARRVWNGMVDKRPALIARCAGAADVVTCVRFAQEHDAKISVRGGGHNYAGKSVCDDGLMIDLSTMKGIRVDPARRTAHAQAGVRLGEFDRETQAFGLATTLGVNTDTGIAGLTLGGGYGWLAGKHGLACDNVVSMDVVTADGQFLTASATEHEDLFWGMRGAGANLGIVTAFEYRLHPVGPVLGGMVIYPLRQGRDVLRFFDEYSAGCPDEVSTAGLLLTTPDGTPAVAIAACHAGPLEAGEKALRPVRTFATPMADLIAPQPYVQMQTLFDEAWPPGRRYYNKSSIVRRLSETAIEVLLFYAGAMPTPLSAIALQQLHGVAARVAPDATAFPHRYDHHSCYVHPATDDPAESEKIVRWGRDCWEALQPFVEPAVYVNALEDAQEDGVQRVREAYGPNYPRLGALKKKYDPTNMLSSNQNIAT